mmetsp:Transcript_6906/g.42154  ORF Transcript_6906/g.42154 Transcript_6906/m.42154 type:complete len:178 (+) Transcript_6906:521-1054(+)
MLQKRSKPCKPRPTKEGCSCQSSRQSRTLEKPLAASTKKEDAKEADSAILCTCTNPVWSSANFWVSILVEAEVAVGRGIEAAQGEDRPAHTKEEVTDGAQVRTAGGLDESRPLENESGIAGGTKAENIEAVGVPGAPVLGSITGTKARKEGPKSHVGTWSATREIDRCNKKCSSWAC